MVLLIIFILVLLNGVFSMSEMSLVSSRKFKLENARKAGSDGAKKALELAENPTRFLSTVQIGITLIGIVLGIYSGDNLTAGVVEFLNQVPFLQPYSAVIAKGIIVVFITYLSIVLGELLPKRIGMTFPEPIITLLSRPMHLLSVITAPFVWLLTATNNFLLRLMGIRSNSDNRVSEEEIKSIIRESAEGGEIQVIEQDIVERVFELGDRRVKSLYTHRSELMYFDRNDSWEHIAARILEEKHSAYPVVANNNLDDIQGMVLLKDLFNALSGKPFDIRQYLRKPLYVTENTLAYKLLELFKTQKLHQAIVVDEYGTTVGMVTMDDVMDALVGDATEMGQEEHRIVQRDEKSWLVDGQYSLVEFAKSLPIKLNIDPEEYATISGLLLHEMSAVPDIGDCCRIGNYVFEVIDKDGQRIDKILVTTD